MASLIDALLAPFDEVVEFYDLTEQTDEQAAKCQEFNQGFRNNLRQWCKQLADNKEYDSQITSTYCLNKRSDYRLGVRVDDVYFTTNNKYKLLLLVDQYLFDNQSQGEDVFGIFTYDNCNDYECETPKELIDDIYGHLIENDFLWLTEIKNAQQMFNRKIREGCPIMRLELANQESLRIDNPIIIIH